MPTSTSTLEEISEKLLVRSQEAILQLDLWVLRQQQLHSDETSDAKEETENQNLNSLRRQYDLYMSQLNSLYVRSEFIRDKLNSRNRLFKNGSDHKDIEDLVFEFQDITEKLNDLALSKKNNKGSPKKMSTRSSSMESMKLKPLRVVEKHEKRLSKELELEALEKTVRFVEHKNKHKKMDILGVNDDNEVSRQMHEKRHKVLRNAISYDTGLNSKSRNNRNTCKYRKKNTTDDAYNSLFKNNQRFSISLFEDYVDVSSDHKNKYETVQLNPESIIENLDNNSDQETVISSSGLPSISNDTTIDDYILENSTKNKNINTRIANHTEPVFMRRCASHESILSTKLDSRSQYNRISNKFGQFRITSLCRPTVASVSTTSTTIEHFSSKSNKPSFSKISAPIVTSNTKRITSRDLLTKITENQDNVATLNKIDSENNKSFFGKWNLFSSTYSPSLLGKNTITPTNIISSEIGQKIEDNSTGFTLRANSGQFLPNSRMVDNPPLPATNILIDERVSYNELYDALNTEIKLLF